MNKAKKAVAELKHHLGKDSRGIALLDSVVACINDNRKELARIKEELQHKTESEARLQDELRKTKEALAKERSASETLKARLSQEHRNAARHKQQIKELEQRLKETLEAVEDIPFTFTEQCNDNLSEHVDVTHLHLHLDQLAKAFRVLRSQTKCPPMHQSPVRWSSRLDSDNLLAFYMEDLIVDFSVDSFIKLGRFVACMVMSGFPSRICTKVTIPESRVRDKQIPKAHQIRLVKWFSRSGNTITFDTDKFESDKVWK